MPHSEPRRTPAESSGRPRPSTRAPRRREAGGRSEAAGSREPAAGHGDGQALPASLNEVFSRDEARVQAVLETSPLGILTVRSDGRVVWANTRIESLFGYARGELIGQPVEILLPERFGAAHARHRAGFFAEPRARPMGLGLDLAARRKDGSEFPVEISLSFIETDQGLLAMSFVTDITTRKETEKRLATEFAVTRVLAESPPLAELPARLLRAVWSAPGLDAAGFRAAGRQMSLARGAGLPGRAWAVGRALWAEDVQGDAGFSRVQGAVQLGIQAACAFPIGTEARTAGVLVLFDRRRREPDEQLLKMLTDIGARIGGHLEQSRLEEELTRQREVLYQSEKLTALGRLVAGVAHEMNNPLSIMSSRIELMLTDAADQPLPPQLVEDLKVLHRNTLRVAGVAQALRSFARQSTGTRDPVDLNAVVEETLLLAGKPMATDNIQVTTTLDPALPPLLGDANALQQVLLNLLTNAREAMTGGGTIWIETGPSPERPGWIRLVVADTGPGIAETDLPHLFEPFYTTKLAGTGLGLAVSYGIVQAHQGTIDVRSTPGHGATFTLAFPALERAATLG
jgi:two-component system, cell cycle sensor histidine kinase and response regulator CckA